MAAFPPRFRMSQMQLTPLPLVIIRKRLSNAATFKTAITEVMNLIS